MNKAQNSSEDGISGIDIERTAQIILAKWRTGDKNLRQLADEFGLPIEEVQRILTRGQKSLIQKGSLKP
ncbi:MAG TPA: hypothetical protein VF290_11825 [Pyrinomonadaceae bacterium]